MGHTPITLGLPPDPWASEPRTVVLFGGSFDPPHMAHIELPMRAAKAIDADWLIFIPAAQSPHKDHSPGAGPRDRLAMLEAALRGEPRTSVSDIELRRGEAGPSYTVDTLRELRSRVPGSVTFRLLIGADQALALDRWREAAQIVALAEPLVMQRDGAGSASDLAAALSHLPDPLGGSPGRWRARIVEVPRIDVSSTRVRALLKHGSDQRTRAALRMLVPPRVLECIEARGLYRDVPGTGPA